MANALDIIFGVINAAGEVAIKNNKKKELAHNFELTLNHLKKTYNYCRNNMSEVPYGLYTKALMNGPIMEIEGDTILRMIPYRTVDENLKEIKKFLNKYNMEVPVDGVHIHIHF
jgi:uncharacterized membrane-anchored protein